MNNLPTVMPELIFELGKLQVFHYPTTADKDAGLRPKEVFWQDTVARNTYGPFPSIYDAMCHYTWIVATQKRLDGPNPANVVYVDFSKKKRIIYDVP